MASQQQKLPIQQHPKIAKLVSTQSLNNDITASNSQNIPSFLLKTYQILQNNKYQDIISWTRNGQGFIVKKIKQFSQTVLPIYFRHNNYTSFVRQLNMYDFHKTRQENQQNAFKNFLFKKGQKYLLKQIQRKDYKKNKQTNKQLYNMLERNNSNNRDKINFNNPGVLGSINNPSLIGINQNSTMTDIAQLEAQTFGSKIKEDAHVVNSFPGGYSQQNQCFRSNIIQLKKLKHQMQDKSLKLMCFKEGKLTNEIILKAIDTLFQCSLTARKTFNQIEVLKTDYELHKRKTYFESFRNSQTQPNKNNQLEVQRRQELSQKKIDIFNSQKIQTKHSLGGFKQLSTQMKQVSNIYNSNSQLKISLFSGYERYQASKDNKINLFQSYKNQ